MQGRIITPSMGSAKKVGPNKKKYVSASMKKYTGPSKKRSGRMIKPKGYGR